MKLLFLLATLVLLLPAQLWADGGRIRLHRQAGPFLITLFTTPDPLVAGPADFSVAVERADGRGLVQDAEVTLILTTAQSAEGTRMVATATHAAATSRFLQAVNLQLPASGVWHVAVLVSEGADAGSCEADFDVQPQTTYQSQTLWQVLLIPMLILLYVVHQRRRSKQMNRLIRA